jgi:hypothetical protein
MLLSVDPPHVSRTSSITETSTVGNIAWSSATFGFEWGVVVGAVDWGVVGGAGPVGTAYSAAGGEETAATVAGELVGGLDMVCSDIGSNKECSGE